MIRGSLFVIGVAFSSSLYAQATLPKADDICIYDDNVTGLYRIDEIRLLSWVIHNSGVNATKMFSSGRGSLSNDELVRDFLISTNSEPGIGPVGVFSDFKSTEITKLYQKGDNVFSALAGKSGVTLSSSEPFLLRNSVADSTDISKFGLYNEGKGTFVECYKSAAAASLPAAKETVSGIFLLRESSKEFSKEGHKAASGGKLSYEKDRGADKSTSKNVSKLAAGYQWTFKYQDGEYSKLIRGVTLFGSYDGSKTRTITNADNTINLEVLEYQGAGVSLRSEIDSGNVWNNYFDTSLEVTIQPQHR